MPNSRRETLKDKILDLVGPCVVFGMLVGALALAIYAASTCDKPCQDALATQKITPHYVYIPVHP